MNISKNLVQIKFNLPQNVKLVAVSKNQKIDALMEAYNGGQRVFAENKAQEMRIKQMQMPKDVEWHFIGHLQTNKIKYIIQYVSLIQSVDSYKLLKEINKEAWKSGRVVDCLLQFHIATEESKFGLNKEEVQQMLSSPDYLNLKNINIMGVMGMATFTEDKELIRKEFRYLKSIFDSLKRAYFQNKPSFSEISMGMTSDYMIAIEEGSTIVRLGTIVFGNRIN